MSLSHRPIWALGLLALVAMPAAAADIYRWTDSDGRVHYGASPPPGAKASAVLRAEPGPSAQQQSEAQVRAQRDKARAEADARQREAQQAQAQADAQAQAQARQQRLQRCAEAVQQQDLLQRGGPVWRETETGQKVFLPDNQRDAELARLRAEVRAHCDVGTHADQNAAISARLRQADKDAACAAAQEKLQMLSEPMARAPDWLLAEQREKVRRACER